MALCGEKIVTWKEPNKEKEKYNTLGGTNMFYMLKKCVYNSSNPGFF